MTQAAVTAAIGMAALVVTAAARKEKVGSQAATGGTKAAATEAEVVTSATVSKTAHAQQAIEAAAAAAIAAGKAAAKPLEGPIVPKADAGEERSLGGQQSARQPSPLSSPPPQRSQRAIGHDGDSTTASPGTSSAAAQTAPAGKQPARVVATLATFLDRELLSTDDDEAEEEEEEEGEEREEEEEEGEEGSSEDEGEAEGEESEEEMEEALRACNLYYGLISTCTPITSLPNTGEKLGEKLREAMQMLKRSTKLLSCAHKSSLASQES
ncbi:hypothetical protein HaLaN_06963 [Haematococcus lacustris]|uniref:Uncharacterized protein n=1 Tax=Haematococcus lacustris TaxID=44745 RepID=A0A699Z7H3_HAELA|nr:hypothetical protein HaLaN_06963 [Haematococcus lacustris]